MIFNTALKIFAIGNVHKTKFYSKQGTFWVNTSWPTFTNRWNKRNWLLLNCVYHTEKKKSCDIYIPSSREQMNVNPCFCKMVKLQSIMAFPGVCTSWPTTRLPCLIDHQNVLRKCACESYIERILSGRVNSQKEYFIQELMNDNDMILNILERNVDLTVILLN